MPSFEVLGLRDELLRTLEEEDVWTPTAVQESVIPALRRGGNLVARASAGSGKTLGYTLGVLDRVEVPGLGKDRDAQAVLRVLVLVSTPEEAERVALSMVPYAQAVGVQVASGGPGWGTSPGAAEVLVAVPSDVLAAVRAADVKLDEVGSAIVDGASAMVDLGEWSEVDALLDLIPREAQRVVFTAAIPQVVEDLIGRRVKRALRYPAEPAISGREQAAPTERIGFVIASEREKLELLARQLRQVGEASSPPIIFCRNDERAAELAEQLTIRGFIVGQPNEAEADVAIAAGGVTRAELTEEVTGEPGQTISFDVPADAATLRDRHAGDPDAAVLIEPREIAHLREIAGQAGARVDAAAMPLDLAGSAAGLEAFRREIRSAIAAEDLTAQMLVLEPLFDEFTAAEIAAATAALLRRRQPPATRQESATPSQDKRSEPASRKAAAGPAPVTWARLYVGVGSREEIRPGDLVGTLAGEADIPGSQIGKIEILDNFSIVEVQADVAEKVIQAVNGTTIKGRSVRVDYDRGGPARRPPTRGGSPPRRTTRRPPRENG